MVIQLTESNQLYTSTSDFKSKPAPQPVSSAAIALAVMFSLFLSFHFVSADQNVQAFGRLRTHVPHVYVQRFLHRRRRLGSRRGLGQRWMGQRRLGWRLGQRRLGWPLVEPRNRKRSARQRHLGWRCWRRSVGRPRRLPRILKVSKNFYNIILHVHVYHRYSVVQFCNNNFMFSGLVTFLTASEFWISDLHFPLTPNFNRTLISLFS